MDPANKRIKLLDSRGSNGGFFAPINSRRMLTIKGIQIPSQNHMNSSQTPSILTPQNLLPKEANKSFDSTSKNSIQKPREDVVHLETRNRAKDVLRELDTYRIGFAELVEEGIDPIILQDLYDEIELHFSDVPAHQNSVVTPLRQQTENRHEANRSEIYPAKVGTYEGKGQTSGQHRFEPQSSTYQQTFNVPITLGFDQGLPLSRAGNDVKLSVSTGDLAELRHNTYEKAITNIEPSQVSSALPTNTSAKPLMKSSNAINLSKSTISKSGDGALERKDHIARLLAAKASKPAVQSNLISGKSDLISRADESTSTKTASRVTQPVIPIKRQCFVVKNLPPTATQSDIRSLFSRFSM